MQYSFVQPHPYGHVNPYVASPYTAPIRMVNNWSTPQYSGACNPICADPHSMSFMPALPTAIPTPIPFVQTVQTGLNSTTNLTAATQSCQFSPFCTSHLATASALHETTKNIFAHSADTKSSPGETHSPDFPFQRSMTENDDGRQKKIIIEDLVDSNLAGSAHSPDCTLILTEGKAAMSLAVAGLSATRRDLYGVYAIKRRPINVCKASKSEVMKDAEANNIIDILGLQFDFAYDDNEELKTLRYGKVLLMMDRDEDGSHMKGLIMNLFYKYWPSLLRRNSFLMQSILPVVKVWLSDEFGDHVLAFHTLEDYEDWRSQVEKYSVYKLTSRHYRSLESFTPQEIVEFFLGLHNNCVHFRYEDDEDHKALTLAFEKDRENRKEWIRRSLRESFTHYENLREMRYKDFVNKELLFYSDLQNLRSFPSAIDGLTRSQRKVLHAYYKNHYEQEVGVLRLMGSVLDVSAYKQSMDALGQTVINMAHDFVGANNINTLIPIGQFGTRLHGGKDAGKVKYLRTKVNSIMKYIFSELDFPILNYREENDLVIEPFYFLPIIPMILINGSDGIGTGWKTKIPKYDTEDIIKNLFRMLDNLEPTNMVPCFKNFKGRIEMVDDNDNQFYSYGVISVHKRNQVRITELPIGVWTEAYKLRVLTRMRELGSILCYEEFPTDHTSVNFLVTLRRQDLLTIPEEELYDMFDLKTSEKSYFVAFNHQGLVEEYKNSIQILEEYFDVRLQAYEARKTHMIEKNEFDLKALEDFLQKVRYGDRNVIMYNPHGEKHNFGYDTRGIQENEIKSLERAIIKAREKLEQLRQKTRADLWREDLEILCSKLRITAPKPCKVNDENSEDLECISSMSNLRLSE